MYNARGTLSKRSDTFFWSLGCVEMLCFLSHLCAAPKSGFMLIIETWDGLRRSVTLRTECVQDKSSYWTSWRILELGRPIGPCSSNTEQAKVQFFIISHMLATLLHWINALRLLKSKEYQATSTHCNYCARLSLHWALSNIWILHWALNPSLSTLSIIWILNPTFQQSAALRQ